MKHVIRTGLALILAGLMAAPSSAQTANPPAAKGEVVVVQLRDGREIVGEVGKCLDDLGLYVKPPDSAAYLVHRDDVVGIHVAATGAARSFPIHERHGMSAGTAATLAVFATVGLIVLMRSILPTG